MMKKNLIADVNITSDMSREDTLSQSKYQSRGITDYYRRS
jgi:hypothetical protein